MTFRDEKLVFDQKYGIDEYSVMQSDGNSFYGDVVSDSFGKTSRDEDNILDQINKSNMFVLLL